jgi:formate C-acetyltransferase
MPNRLAAGTATNVAQRAPSPRIARIRTRYQTGDSYISVERARHYTASWKATAKSGLATEIRVATAMKHVYENMTHHLDADDRIAGHWTEHFLGVPVDIERGLFNTVLGAELSKPAMLRFRLTAGARSLNYMLRKRALLQFLRDQKTAAKAGGAPLDLGLKTMDERKINPFHIAPADKRELLGELLPWWRGRTLVDLLEGELTQAGLHSESMHEFAQALPGNTSKQVMMLASCATVATMQGHLILDYDRVLADGLTGMLAAVDARLEDPALTAAERDALRAQRIALEGVAVFAERLAERIAAEIERTPDAPAHLHEMLAICRKVPLAPATTFREAVQAMWTVKTAVELAHPINLHCFGRLDQQLYPYYAADLQAGRITPEAALELLEELLLKVMTQNLRPESNVLSNFYHRFFGSTPVTLAGVTPDGRDGTNALTYLFLQAAHRSKAITNVSVRVHPDSPPELLATVAELLHAGTSSFSLFNDTVNIEAMERRGFTPEDARDYAVMGCVETTCPGKTGSMSANALLLSRMLDITLRNGDSRTLAGMLRAEGPATGAAESFQDFESFLEAYLTQGRYFIDKIVKGSNVRDRLFAEHLPAPAISAFTVGCLEKARDVTHGGGKYDLSGISLINSIANATDSLFVIKKLVFEERRFTLPTLLAAVDANYEGYSEVENAIRDLQGKWGNGNPETDALAHRVMRALCDETYNYRGHKGGPFVVYTISMTTHTIDGRLSIATPDGRKAATPYAASGNPYNVDRSGITAVLRSVAALPTNDLMGCAVNARFHPSGIGRNAAAREKWAELIRTYFALGGSQLQPTVASSETLRQAQLNPASFRDLIIKVGGYSTYFVDLGREIQNEIIARTEHAA